MKSYLHVLVVLAINAKIADANFHYTGCDMTKLKQTHQCMDSRHMQRVNCSAKKVLGEHST